MTDRIEIKTYTSHGFDHLDTNDVVLVAWGRINGKKYTYARVTDDVGPGMVPQWFMDDAQEAFRRAEYRMRGL